MEKRQKECCGRCEYIIPGEIPGASKWMCNNGESENFEEAVQWGDYCPCYVHKPTETELKKEYLQSYRNHVRRIRRIEAELEEIRAMRGSMAINYDGMPHGSGQGDLSSYAAQLDELEEKLIKERYYRVIAYKDITNQINALKSEHEKDVLFYRYIKGLEWWEIAEKMGYSERHITRLHGNGIKNFTLPEKMSYNVRNTCGIMVSSEKNKG